MTLDWLGIPQDKQEQRPTFGYMPSIFNPHASAMWKRAIDQVDNDSRLGPQKAWEKAVYGYLAFCSMHNIFPLSAERPNSNKSIEKALKKIKKDVSSIFRSLNIPPRFINNITNRVTPTPVGFDIDTYAIVRTDDPLFRETLNDKGFTTETNFGVLETDAYRLGFKKAGSDTWKFNMTLRIKEIPAVDSLFPNRNDIEEFVLKQMWYPLMDDKLGIL